MTRLLGLVACGALLVSSPAAQAVDRPGSDREAINRLAARHLLLADDRAFFEDAARLAWRYADAAYAPRTGFLFAVDEYEFATIWDIGSGLAALYAAHELGFLPTAEFEARMGRALGTLKAVRLYKNGAFNKAYSVRDGAMLGPDDHKDDEGAGWSATDIGRLLIWLRIVADRHPQFAGPARDAAARLDYPHIVKDGYLWGGTARGRRTVTYPEGQIGYEQYAARGFALWGHRADKALDLGAHGVPLTVMGQQVLGDSRRRDRLTSEPLVLYGLELGWPADVRALALAVLAAQEERARRTGILTMVSEDAISVPPHFFYYYCVYANAREFAVDVQTPGAEVDGPRWLSAKAAVGWHALHPTPYTRRVIEAIAPARSERGWSSGVFEGTGESTRTLNVNTAAVIMTAALYARTGAPVLAGAREPFAAPERKRR